MLLKVLFSPVFKQVAVTGIDFDSAMLMKLFISPVSSKVSVNGLRSFRLKTSF
jgi:hypothetical protein